MGSAKTKSTTSPQLSPEQATMVKEGAPNIQKMLQGIFGGDPTAFDKIRQSVRGIYGESSQFLAPIKSQVAQAKERIFNTMQAGGRRDAAVAQIEAQGALAESKGMMDYENLINQQVGQIGLQPLDMLYAILTGQPNAQTTTQRSSPGSASTINSILQGGSAAALTFGALM